MGKTLKEYFPMIRVRESIEAEINASPKMTMTFQAWKEKERQEFLDVCTGTKGVKMLYDSFFKEIMNAEYDSKRLDSLLSELLKQRVHIKKVLPDDSTRIADERSLLIMDIVVELESGALANIEVQKLGYLFPGEMSACYSADLLLRQYKRLRGEKGEHFTYKDIQTVFVIVLFEHSSKVFHEMPDVYYHYSEQKTDTGLELEQPQKFIYLALDNFKKKQDNGDVTIHNKLEAWLTFLCRDEPEWIARLLEQYPEFEPLYKDIYELCQNMERVMELFSKELRIMDRNTVKLMIDELQAERDQWKNLSEEQLEQLKAKTKQLEKQAEQIDEQAKQINEQAKQINKQAKQINEQAEQLDEQKLTIEHFGKEIAELKRMMAGK